MCSPVPEVVLLAPAAAEPPDDFCGGQVAPGGDQRMLGAVAAAFVDLPQRQRAVLAAVELGAGFGEGVGVFDTGVGVGEALLSELGVAQWLEIALAPADQVELRIDDLLQQRG